MTVEKDDFREFMREMRLRWERHERTVIARFEANTAKMNEQTAAMRDHREETRAQTQAILRLLDRMSRFDDNGGEAPA